MNLITHKVQESNDTVLSPKRNAAAPNMQTQMMAEFRAQATFDSSHLATLIYGRQVFPSGPPNSEAPSPLSKTSLSPNRKEAVATRNEAFARVEKALGTSDMSKLPRCYGNLNREDEFLDGLRTGKLCLEDSWKFANDVLLYSTERCAMGNASPFGIHTFLFLPFLKQQCSPEQYKYWVPLAESGKILGAYCQTELGHGSHVGGIETTATFDQETDEFIIHSPTVESTKYWPGGLGFTCSHAAVMARLIINDQDYGIHPFMVQIRSLVDYKPVECVELGDIGSKMAYKGTDNGYAVFEHVRIPRTHLLGHHATVSSNGTYTRSPIREKLMYGGMLNGRFLIICQSAIQLAQALTTATRYSVVREQGLSPFSEANTNKISVNPVSIIYLKSQHYRLLTLISKAYATIFVWHVLAESYKDMERRQEKGDHSTLKENHIMMAGLKAWATENAANGAEDARKMCGGHGYMNISGLPDIVLPLTAMCTFEGENWVMWQQVAVYLIKGLAGSDLPLQTGMAYMANYRICFNSSPCTSHGSDFLSTDILRRIFEHRASRLTSEAQEMLKSSELSNSAAWNKNMMPLISAARAHIDVHVLKAYTFQVSSLPPSPTRDVLSKLVSLYGLTTIIAPDSNNAISFVLDGHLSHSQLSEMREQVDVLLEQLLPDSIALTDAWQFTDASLASTIGCKDGNAYERIMLWTRQPPINLNAKANGGVFKEGWDRYIGPVIRAKL